MSATDLPTVTEADVTAARVNDAARESVSCSDTAKPSMGILTRNTWKNREIWLLPCSLALIRTLLDLQVTRPELKAVDEFPSRTNPGSPRQQRFRNPKSFAVECPCYVEAHPIFPRQNGSHPMDARLFHKSKPSNLFIG